MSNIKHFWYLIKIVFIVFIFTSCHINNVENGNKNNDNIVKDSIDENINKMDYTPISLPKLIAMSDLVVQGEITSIKENDFKFKIKEFLIKKDSSKQIVVKKYLPSSFFLPKRTPYVKGQQFVLFLEQQLDKNKTLPFKIIGIAGEGEMPLEDGFVYFEGSYLNGLKPVIIDKQDVNRKVQRFNYTDFNDAISNYNKCFDWKIKTYIKNKKTKNRWTPSNKCSDVDLKTYQTKSWIHKYLTVETLKKIPK